MSPPSRRHGFTLIELMIVVAILGLLAAVAVPSFAFYLRRSKTVDAKEALRHMFQHVTAYYIPEQTTRGLSGNLFDHCTVGSTDNRVTPRDDKLAGDYSSAEWKALNFIRQRSYFRLEIDSAVGSRCGNLPDPAPLYQLRAVGDLDADGVTSLFELSVGRTIDNELFHSRGFYIENEAE